MEQNSCSDPDSSFKKALRIAYALTIITVVISIAILYVREFPGRSNNPEHVSFVEG